MRYVYRVAFGAVLFGLLAAPAQAQDFSGPVESVDRPGFYISADYRYDKVRSWECKHIGQAEDGADMWHCFDFNGIEYTASCLLSPGTDYDNYSDGGPGQLDCGVSAVAEPVTSAAAHGQIHLYHALTTGMYPQHMPEAVYAVQDPWPAPSEGGGQDQVYC